MTTKDPAVDREIERAVLTYIRMVADVAIQSGHGRPEWIYRSAYQLLLEHGRFFVPGPRPPSISKMPDRLCYENATATVRADRRHGLVYAEGFASPEVASGLSLEHAWCVTPSGTVVDPTWQDTGAVYFGVAFADSAMMPTGGGGLLSDFDRCLPLLRNGILDSVLADVGRGPREFWTTAQD